MSMRKHPNSGYVCLVSKFRNLIPLGEQISEFDELLENDDREGMQGFLINQRQNNRSLWRDIPEPLQCFSLTDEDVCEELEVGEMYAEFAEGDLFRKVPKAGYIQMKDGDFDLEFRNWAVLG